MIKDEHPLHKCVVFENNYAVHMQSCCLFWMAIWKRECFSVFVGSES